MDLGQDDGLNWNELLLPDDANGLGIGGELDLGLGVDAFGDVGLNDGDIFGSPGFDIGSGEFVYDTLIILWGIDIIFSLVGFKFGEIRMERLTVMASIN